MPSSSSSSSSSSQFLVKKTDLQHHSVSIFITHAKDLRNVETIGKLDPYVIVKVGKSTVTSPVLKDHGCNPSMNFHFKMPYNGEKTIRFIVKDKKRLGKDKECGRGKMQLTAVSGKLTGHVIKLNFNGKKDMKSSGFMFLSYKFRKEVTPTATVEKFDPQEFNDGDKIPQKVDCSHSFKSIRFTVYQAKNLKDTDKHSKIDPYATVVLGNTSLRSVKMKNAGVNPVIRTAFVMPYNSERMLHLRFFDSDLGKDDQVGSVKIDLLPFFKTGDKLSRGRACLILKGKDSAPGGTVDCKVELMTGELEKAEAIKLKEDSSSSSSSSS